ncbi:MAG: cobyrinate a,c-diamide synthase [Desulfomonilaceae bacterium]
MVFECPRIVIAGTNSGVGKTSVTLALVSALRKRGLRVQTFKVGPDYLDPTYLSIASGQPCYNLDGWMTDRNYVTKLFLDKASGADLAVIEGVMGLFDGSDPEGPEGSTAEIASWLNAPVLLVVNVHGLARSLAAIVHGFADFDPGVKISGVIANHCGSERHGKWISHSLEASHLPKLVAHLTRGSLPSLPSRHLGLVSADARILNQRVLDEMGQAIEKQCSLPNILAIARNASPLKIQPPTISENPSHKSIQLGIARDEAFHFYYMDNLEALSAAGCELVEFSPVRSGMLPEGLDALYLGGGYPEEHAAELADNRTMIDSIKRFAESGRPVYAECGGLMYLSKGIQSKDLQQFELVGLFPSWTRMLPRLKSLGYAEITLTQNSLFGAKGTRIRGHEYHYSELISDPTENGYWTKAYQVTAPLKKVNRLEGFQRENILVSYIHGHFASKPNSVSHFVSLCKNVKRREN